MQDSSSVSGNEATADRNSAAVWACAPKDIDAASAALATERSTVLSPPGDRTSAPGSLAATVGRRRAACKRAMTTSPPSTVQT